MKFCLEIVASYRSQVRSLLLNGTGNRIPGILFAFEHAWLYCSDDFKSPVMTIPRSLRPLLCNKASDSAWSRLVANRYWIFSAKMHNLTVHFPTITRLLQVGGFIPRPGFLTTTPTLFGFFGASATFPRNS